MYTSGAYYPSIYRIHARTSWSRLKYILLPIYIYRCDVHTSQSRAHRHCRVVDEYFVRGYKNATSDGEYKRVSECVCVFFKYCKQYALGVVYLPLLLQISRATNKYWAIPRARPRRYFSVISSSAFLRKRIQDLGTTFSLKKIIYYISVHLNQLNIIVSKRKNHFFNMISIMTMHHRNSLWLYNNLNNKYHIV